MDDLAVFTPEPRIVTVRGLDPITILPVKVRNLSAFSKAVFAILPYVEVQDWIGAATHATEATIAAVAIGSGVDAERIGDLYPDDLLALAATVFEVNLDFFARQILPAEISATARIQAALPHGAAASPILPPEATG